jgi:hypothetical protein
MKRKWKFGQRIAACAAAVLMVVGVMPLDFAGIGTKEAKAENKTYVLEAKDLTAFAQGKKNDGDTETAGTDNYFTIIYSASSKVDESSKTWTDGYASGLRINFGGKATTGKNSIKFTTSGAATVKVWWVPGAAQRQLVVFDSTKATEIKSDAPSSAGSTISTLNIDSAGTYYLGGYDNNNYIFKVEVTESGSSTPVVRGAWADVSDPSITSVALNSSNSGKIDVTVAADVSNDGADTVTVTMTDGSGNTTEKQSTERAETHTLTFEPTASGTYTFSAKISRKDEQDKTAAETKSLEFKLPMAAPASCVATNKGGGSVKVEWGAVTEAKSYTIKVANTDIEKTTTDTEITFDGLTVGTTYTITILAVRDEDTSAAGLCEVTVSSDSEIKWQFSTYGSSTSTKKDTYKENSDGSVTVSSTGNGGKIVPANTDGLAFYYTAIDPATQNFTLTADITVDSWSLSNGQEGFGLMAADTVAANGTGTAFWNNSFQNIATKIEYNYDDETQSVTDSDDAYKISMKLGVGAIAKTGVTAADVAAIKAGEYTMPPAFVSETNTLETSCGEYGTGTYNIFGNYTNSDAPTGTVENTITKLKMSIQRNNTGYILRLYDESGNKLGEQIYYHDGEDALTQIDSKHIYVGIFASRNATITASNIELTTIAPESDEPKQERPIEQVTPKYVINSATTANSENYTFIFRSNADGTLKITDASGNIVIEKSDVKANTNITAETKLANGDNEFDVTFTPNTDYVPGKYKVLSSYDAQSFKFTVSYRGFEGERIYVSPNGSASGDGTKDNPTDIYTAVKYVKAGQTIILTEGTYNLTQTVTVERGINGTADSLIYMIADPDAASRPVLDFGGNCAGMVLAGNYWYFKGFDVTKSADAQKGIQVSGSHNTLELIETYKNGNTGLQISRYLGTDARADWPSYNLILNCTSYENADKGYEDADGFAAKLTVGDGNVFDGCISHHNADDGWDLYAKVQNGSIGKVVIQNCVAYMNGYITGSDGNLIDAGNGNGFKMGGDSMSGYHELRNSISFMNKAKGIDSNSCPDIQVYDSVTFNNESYNVAFYTNTAVNTDYYASGVISYRTDKKSVAETIKPLGTQDTTKIYGSTNYYWDTSSQTSKNTNGVTVEDDWFQSLEFTGIDRNEDGSINTHGFLALTEKGQAAIKTADSSAGGSDNNGNGGGSGNEAGSGSDNEAGAGNGAGNGNGNGVVGGSGSGSGNGNGSGSGSGSEGGNGSGSSDDESYGGSDDSVTVGGSGSAVTGSNGGSGSAGTGSNSGSGSTGTGGDSGSGSGSSTPVGDVLTAGDIPGADVVQIDGVDFAQMGGVSQAAGDILAAIDSNGQITTNDTVMQTTAEVAETVLNKLENSSDTSIAVFASENASVGADVVNKLAETGKTLSIGVVDGSGKVSAIVTLDGSKLNTANNDFSLKITVDVQSTSVARMAANYGIAMSSYSVVDFSYSGNLPGTFKVAVDVSDKFADGTQLALYYNNTQAGRLENQYQVTSVSGGFAEFAIDHCSEYVLVDVSAARNMITTNTLSSPKTADAGHVIFWLVMMGVAAAGYFGFEAYMADRKKVSGK